MPPRKNPKRNSIPLKQEIEQSFRHLNAFKTPSISNIGLI